MSCYCADWCTGRESCHSDPTVRTVEECQAFCRCGGKAYIAFFGSAGCGGQVGVVCGFVYKPVWTCKPVQPLPFDMEWSVGSGECCPANVCVDNSSAKAWCHRGGLFPVGSILISYFSVCVSAQVLEWIGLLHSGICADSEGASQIQLPCCLGTECKVTRPSECSIFGGRWQEGGVFTEIDPCGTWPDVSPNLTHPCNVGPCCGTGAFDCHSNLPGNCFLLASGRCEERIRNGQSTRWSRPATGGVGCHRPGACAGGSRPCDAATGCVGGGSKDDFAVTFRPSYHQPPNGKAWLEGSAELVSINPQRPIRSRADVTDCAFHYADIAVVRDAPGGDAFMLQTCSQQDFVSPRIHHGPLVFRGDGNARFALAYRAA